MGKIISITSGKGGVGKTMTTINMAVAASKSKAKVLIVDGDLGLSNVDVLMGLEPKGTLKDVLDGHMNISEIISTTPHGIDVISSGSGVTQLANMSPLNRSFLVHELSRLPDVYDYVFIDTGAGISESVLTLNSISDLFVVVTTPEPHAITDAYALIKVMAEEHERTECAVIINQTINADEGKRIANKLFEVARTYCGSNVIHAGTINSDSNLVRSVLGRRVGGEGALSTLCGQGWSQSWCSIQQLLNSCQIPQRSEGLSDVWSALSATSNRRQFLDL